jgi:hypothetical protein
MASSNSPHWAARLSVVAGVLSLIHHSAASPEDMQVVVRRLADYIHAASLLNNTIEVLAI